MCRSKNAGVAGYAEAFRPVQSDSQTSEWYSYFENDVLVYGMVMKGKKKISDYLTDRKFSISQKERQWVLCCGERIAWLIGERTDNRFRIDETTKRVIIYKIV